MVAQGHEGVMAKDLASRYQPGRRSPAWRKLKPWQTLPCLAIGFTSAERREQALDQLLVATLRDGILRYVATLRLGLSWRERILWARQLAGHTRSQPLVACDQEAVWLEPGIYCQVRCAGWTLGGHLRHPSFGGWLSGASP